MTVLKSIHFYLGSFLWLKGKVAVEVVYSITKIAYRYISWRNIREKMHRPAAFLCRCAIKKLLTRSLQPIEYVCILIFCAIMKSGQSLNSFPTVLICLNNHVSGKNFMIVTPDI